MNKLIRYMRVLVFPCLITQAIFGKTVYVSTNGTAISPYDSWETASTNIQEAIYVAISNDVVLVADGIYAGQGNYDINFNGKTIQVISLNGAESCIIDCQQLGRAFIFNNSEGTNASLCGFAMRNGKATSEQVPESRDCRGGGAILCDGASPSIKECIFENNFARSSPWGNLADGGAIDLLNGSTAIISHNIFRNNEATHTGGAIHVGWESSPLIYHNSIISNTCDGCYGGGAIALLYNSSGQIVNNSILFNTSKYYSNGGYGGGIICMNSNPDIFSNTIMYNTTRNGEDLGEGGGIRIRGLPSPSIKNCIIWGNESDPGLEDLDFQYPSWNLDISHCVVGIGLEDVQCQYPESNLTNNPCVQISVSSGYPALTPNSICIEAGTNMTWMVDSTDLQGEARIAYDSVDVGVDEAVIPTMISYLKVTDEVTFEATAPPCGIMYLEKSDSLSSPSWIPCDSHSTTTQRCAVLTDLNWHSSTQGYYRVRWEKE